MEETRKTKQKVVISHLHVHSYLQGTANGGNQEGQAEGSYKSSTLALLPTGHSEWRKLGRPSRR